jgi:hypothetical protein
MKPFKEFILEIDAGISTVLDRADSRKREKLVDYLHKRKVRQGKESGFTKIGNSGSSRKVYPNLVSHKITLDGKRDTPIDTVHKVAKYNPLIDHSYKHVGLTMGELQNMVEGRKSAEPYRIIQKKGRGFVTNPHGILPPVFERHPLGHFLHVGAVRPFSDSDKDTPETAKDDKEFEHLTKTKYHPNGMKHSHFMMAIAQDHDTIKKIHHNAQKLWPPSMPQRKEAEHIYAASSHPFTQAVRNFSNEHKIQTGDFVMGNMGVFTHPHTGSKHLVLADSGFSEGVHKEYRRSSITKTSNPNDTRGFESDRS